MSFFVCFAFFFLIAASGQLMLSHGDKFSIKLDSVSNEPNSVPLLTHT